MTTADQNKQIVMRMIDAIRAGDTDAFDALIAEDFFQHNPRAGNGLEALKAFFGPLGPLEVDVARVIAEGDLVVVHAHFKKWDMAGVDIFRIGSGGKITEHWDVLQPVEETTVSGNDMFSQLS